MFFDENIKWKNKSEIKSNTKTPKTLKKQIVQYIYTLPTIKWVAILSSGALDFIYRSHTLKSCSKLRAAIGLRAALENFYYNKIQVYLQ